MKNTLMAGMLTLLPFSAIANSDLVLEGERWEGRFTGYNCGAYSDTVAGPAAHQDFQVKFTTLTSDYTLDNGLLKATFVEEGSLCRYSALVFADNAASTFELVKSKAYAQTGTSKCAKGKAIIDADLEANDYLYWGHPHHVTFMMPVTDASSVCGEGEERVGLDFVVSRFLGER